MPRVSSVRVEQVAVVAHGSGSAGSFVSAVLADPLREACVRLLTVEDRSGDVEQVIALLADRYESAGATIVGGVSLGAHAAARVATGRHGLDGLLLLMPAWTGRPGRVAALSAAAADRVAAEVAAGGFDSAVRTLAATGWAGAELATTWPAYGAVGLVAATRATATSRGPTSAELAAVPAPTGVVAVADDPFHPAAVARRWARLVPRAALDVLPPDVVAADPAAIGRAVVAAWLRAQGSKR
jgi:pimeloyl-ACP methyl ester carboxylesterase